MALRRSPASSYGNPLYGIEEAAIMFTHGEPLAGKPWVLALHARNGPPEMMFLPAPFFGDDMRMLTEAGVVVIAPLVGGLLHWGGPDAMAALDAWYAYATGTLGLASTCGIFAWSMGGLGGLNWAQRNTAKVRAMLLMAPVTNLDYFHGTSWAYEIDWAYSPARTTVATYVQLDATADSLDIVDASGFSTSGSFTIVDTVTASTYKRCNYTGKTSNTLTGVTLVGGGFYDAFVGQSVALLGDYATVTAGYNPVVAHAGLSVPFPVTIFHGDADTTVPYTQSQAYVTAVDDPDVTVEVLPGVEHNPGAAFSPSRTIALLAA